MTGTRMQQHANQIDHLCGILGLGTSASCITFFDVLPVVLQLVSLLIMAVTLAWYAVRFWDRFIGKKDES